jgi:hypothetical protein
MGWTSFNSNLSTKEIIMDEFKGAGEIVAMSCHGRENHVAVKLADRDDNLVVGYTVLVERKDGEVYTKVIEETAFPYYFKASKKVINALSPTDHASANAWRAKCLAEKAKQKIVYKPEDVIDLKHEFICNRVKYSSVKLLYPYKNSWVGVGVDSSRNVITPKFKVSKAWIARYKEEDIHA